MRSGNATGVQDLILFNRQQKKKRDNTEMCGAIKREQQVCAGTRMRVVFCICAFARK